MQHVGQYFDIVKTLPIGIYHYGFLVDMVVGNMLWSTHLVDKAGFGYNILDLQVFSWFTFFFFFPH